jgi:hypothetical protein
MAHGFDLARNLATPLARRGGLRALAPYLHVYPAHVKARWRGRALLDVFSRDFDSHDEAYFRAAIERGLIAVNGARAAPDYALRDGDFVSHTLHRHEPPVAGDAIRVLAGGAEPPLLRTAAALASAAAATAAPAAPAAPSRCLPSSSSSSTSSSSSSTPAPSRPPIVAVLKPGGVPVHPCGPHNFLSLLALLAREHALDVADLHPVHRLDRLTSGRRSLLQQLLCPLTGPFFAAPLRLFSFQDGSPQPRP